jgi:hypothetical protein
MLFKLKKPRGVSKTGGPICPYLHKIGLMMVHRRKISIEQNLMVFCFNSRGQRQCQNWRANLPLKIYLIGLIVVHAYEYRTKLDDICFNSRGQKQCQNWRANLPPKIFSMIGLMVVHAYEYRRKIGLEHEIADISLQLEGQ